MFFLHLHHDMSVCKHHLHQRGNTCARLAGSLAQLKCENKLSHSMKMLFVALAWLGYTLFCGGTPHGVTRMGRPGEQAEDRGGEQGPPRPRQPGSARTADQLDTPANPTNLTPTRQVRRTTTNHRRREPFPPRDSEHPHRQQHRPVERHQRRSRPRQQETQGTQYHHTSLSRVGTLNNHTKPKPRHSQHG